MKYKVISKYHHTYEDENVKLVRYSLVIEAGELRFVDCSASLYMAAKVGLEVDIVQLPPSPFYVDLSEPSIPDIL